MRLEMRCVDRFEVALNDRMKMSEVVGLQSTSNGDEGRFGRVQRSTNFVLPFVARITIGRTDEKVGDEGVEEESAEEE